MINKRLPFKTKLAYGIGSIADGAAYDFIISFLMFYLTTMAGISPIIAGTITSIAIVWDAITDPIVGLVIDRSNSKYGKRRPFIIASLVPLSVSVVMLFSNFNLEGIQKNIFYGFMVIMFWTAYTVFNIPYYALGATLTSDDDERTKLSALRQIFNFIGVLCATTLPTFIVGKLAESGFERSTAWTYAAIVVATIIGLSILVMWIFTKGKERIEEPVEVSEEKHNMFKELFSVLSFKPYLLIIISATAACVTFSFFYADLMYFTTFVLGISELSASVLFTAINISSIVMIPVLTKLALIFDKRNVYIVSLSISGIVMIAAKFITITSLNAAIVYSIIYSIGSAAYWLFIFNLLYDVVDLDELKNGKRRDGVIFSYYSFILKLGGAIATQLLGIMLQFSGFNEELASQNSATLSTIESLFTIYPGIFMLLSGLIILLSPLTKKTIEEVQKALEHKIEGKTYSSKELDKLL